jgi:NAD-dependent deacetylase
MIEQTQVDELKTNIQTAQRIVFLTGAGVSTHSGIPDYRSKNGIYQGTATPPEVLLSEDTLLHHPADFHKFVMDNMYFPAAQPNLIHQKIAEICNAKGTLITQNVDGLDRKAGNQHVIEFHGNLYNIYCTKCQQMFSYQEYQQNFRHDKDAGIIRPGIVLYGEPINQQKVAASLQAVANADLIIICGTSFVVYPFAGLLDYAGPNAKIWAINKTALPPRGRIKQITGDALAVFKLIKLN